MTRERKLLIEQKRQREPDSWFDAVEADQRELEQEALREFGRDAMETDDER